MLLKEAGNLPVAIVRPSIGELQRPRLPRKFKSIYLKLICFPISLIECQWASEWMGGQLEWTHGNRFRSRERNISHHHVQWGEHCRLHSCGFGIENLSFVVNWFLFLFFFHLNNWTGHKSNGSGGMENGNHKTCWHDDLQLLYRWSEADNLGTFGVVSNRKDENSPVRFVFLFQTNPRWFWRYSFFFISRGSFLVSDRNS